MLRENGDLAKGRRTTIGLVHFISNLIFHIKKSFSLDSAHHLANCHRWALPPPPPPPHFVIRQNASSQR